MSGRHDRKHVIEIGQAAGMAAMAMLVVLAGLAQAEAGAETEAESREYSWEPSSANEISIFDSPIALIAQAQPEPIAPQPVAPSEEPVAPTEEPAAPTGETVAEPERPKSEKPQEQLLVEVGGVLLPQGRLQLEPILDYAHSSSNRVAISGFTIFDAIVIGVIRVDGLERDILTAGLNMRYGLANRLQIDAYVPYVYRHSTELLGVGTATVTERTIEGHGIGDVEAGISWQVLSGHGGVPATVLRLRGRFPTGESAFEIPRETIGPGGEQRLTRSPTGSGFYGVGPSVTFLWRADPAVLFMGGGYTFNLERDQGEYGKIDPGDTIEYFAGVNLALSEQIALNVAFRNQITSKTEQDGIAAPGTDVNDARLSLGTSIGLSPSTSLVVTASAGLTDESPDFNFTISLPINF